MTIINFKLIISYFTVLAIVLHVNAIAITILGIKQSPEGSAIPASQVIVLRVQVDNVNDVEAFARTTKDSWNSYEDIKHTDVDPASNSFIIKLGPFSKSSKIEYKIFVKNVHEQKRIWSKSDNIKIKIGEPSDADDIFLEMEQTPPGNQVLEREEIKIRVRIANSIAVKDINVRATNYTRQDDAWKIRKDYTPERVNENTNEYFFNLGSFTKNTKIEYAILINELNGKKHWKKDGKNNFKINIDSMPTLALDDSRTDRINIKIDFSDSKIRQSFALEQGRSIYLQNKIDAERKPDIYVIFFDTMRNDYAMKHGAKIKAFMDNNVTPKYHWVSGTATYYSTFSLFNSLPAFLTYDYIRNKGRHDKDGSFPLRVLKNIGYNLHTFGYYWNCIPKNKPLNHVEWPNFLEEYFGINTQSLHLCKQPNRDDEMVSEFDKNRDPITVSVAKQQITKVLSETNSPNFFFINMYNVHTPYKWPNDLPNPYNPSLNNAQTETLQKEYGVDWLRNSYANAIRGADNNFSDLLDFIGNQKNGEEAIVILISDHGEHLLEKVGKAGHGNRPFRERNQGVMSFKFGKDTDYLKEKINSSVFSTQDLFPTIFDYLKINPSPTELMVGRSLISPSSPGRNSAVTVRASGTNPTREMAITGNKYKLWIYIDENDFYNEAKGFRIFDITDLDDNPIYNLEPFKSECDLTNNEPSAQIRCKTFLLKEFSDGIEEIFPGSTSKG